MRVDSYTEYNNDKRAIRYDEGKPQFHLLPADGLRELGRVYTLGAKKYEAYNWEKGMAWSRCFNSLLRHLYAFWDGQQTDPESGLHHMAHVVWNAMAILVYSLRSIGIDDRKGAYMSAQQNIAAKGANMWPDVEARAQIDNFLISKSAPYAATAAEAVSAEIDRGMKNPFKRELPLPASVVVHPSKLRCYNCPNDALPHHMACQDCLTEQNNVRNAE